MSKLLPFPSLKEARREAAQWVVRADRGLTAAERAELARWQTASQMNRRALRELGGLWTDMSSMSALAELYPRAARAPALASRPVLRRVAMAAAIGVVAVGSAWLWRHGPGASAGPSPAPPAAAAVHSRVFETHVGVHRSESLQDGSSLQLNTDSQVSMSFSAGHRDLTLARGEAHFQVAHDAASPFRVRVGNRIVQAVGTAFSVRLRSDGDVDVLVTEGTVEVMPAVARDEAPPKRVTQRELLHIDAAGTETLRTIDVADQQMRLAWQRGMVAFAGETLPEVIAEFSRYTERTIVIADPRLRRERVGGYFRAGDVEGLLTALRANFNVAATTDERGRILLTVAR